jgi:hypothetical protein
VRLAAKGQESGRKRLGRIWNWILVASAQVPEDAASPIRTASVPKPGALAATDHVLFRMDIRTPRRALLE